MGKALNTSYKYLNAVLFSEMAARVAFLVLCAVLLSGLAFSQPVDDYELVFAIDRETGDCFNVQIGDECFECLFPPHLEALQESELGQCVDWPDMGKDIPLEENCEPIQAQDCCMRGISDSGDCRNLVVNEPEAKCGFVENISECGSFPDDWQRGLEGSCPGEGFQWAGETVECFEEGSVSPGSNRPSPSGNGQPPLPEAQKPDTGRNITPLELAAIIIVVVGALSFVAYKKLRV